MELEERGVSGVDLAITAGFEDVDLHPLHARCFLHLPNDALGTLTIRVHQQGDHPCLRN